MTTKRRYKNVSEMARHLNDAADAKSDSFVPDLERRLSSRNVTKSLMAQRAARGLSQADLASKLGCTQSRISKLEAGVDEDLRLGDLRQYLSAMGMDMTIVVGKHEPLAAEQIKYHWSCLGALLNRLVELAGRDSEIAKGVGRFSTEVAFNIGSQLFEFLRRLPDDAKAEMPPMMFLEDDPQESPAGVGPSENRLNSPLPKELKTQRKRKTRVGK